MSIYRRGFVIVLAVMPVLYNAAPAAAAQGKALTGLIAVDLLVERLAEDEAKCNITKDGLDASVRLPVSASPLRLDPNSTETYIYLNVNALLTSSNGCVASVRLALIRWSSEFSESVTVWDKSLLMTGQSHDFGSRVRVSVEELTKDLISAWLKANPRKYSE